MILNLKEAKEKTIEFLNKTSYSLVRPEFTKYDIIYLFTTENLSYLEKINVNGKDVLTVTGSFDQALNLIFLGAKHICNFDVNQLSIYFARLKLAAIKCFSYKEYLNFFLGENCFDYQAYLKLRDYLGEPFLEYWNFIYETFSYSGENILKSRLIDRTKSIKNIIDSNPYLRSELNYNLTKQKLDKVSITFEEKNLLEIGLSEEKYDLMLFSNIESYLVADYYSTMKEEDYLNFIKNQAINQLNDDGVIQIAYKYKYNYKNNTITNTKNILKKIKERSKRIYDKKEYLEEFKKIVFMGYSLYDSVEMSNDVQDCVYLYKKEKTKKR